MFVKHLIFSSPEHEMPRVSYCDHSPSVAVRMYVTIRSWMCSIMGPMGLEKPELFAIAFGKNAEFDIFYTLSSTNINQSLPNLVKNVNDNKVSNEFYYEFNQD